jgi:hypothetical protein
MMSHLRSIQTEFSKLACYVGAKTSMRLLLNCVNGAELILARSLMATKKRKWLLIRWCLNLRQEGIMTHFKQYKPFMAYLEPAEIDKLKKFAKQTKLPMAQIVREAISQRMANGDPYQAGFNAGVDKSIDTVNNMKPAQFRFPSGKSFAEMIDDELNKLKRREKKTKEVADAEGGNITEPV